MNLVIRGFLSGPLVTRGLLAGAAAVEGGPCPDPFAARVTLADGRPDPFMIVQQVGCTDPFNVFSSYGIRVGQIGDGGGGGIVIPPPVGGGDLAMGMGAVIDFAVYSQSDQKGTNLLTFPGVIKDPLGHWIYAKEGYLRPGNYTITGTGKGRVDLIDADLPSNEKSWTFTTGGEEYTLHYATTTYGVRGRAWIKVVDASDPLRDIRIYPEGLDPDTQVHHPDYVAGVAGCYALRSVHYYNIEGDKRGGTDTTWDTASPTLWALFCTLCNEAGSRPWLNLPHQATEDYCRELGALVAANLPPGVIPFLEYSNEIWNYSSPYGIQTTWVREQGAAIGINDFRKAYAYFANKCFVAFEEGFGSVCERVYAGQHVQPGTISNPLAYAQDNGWRVDGIAGAPYLNPTMPWADITAAYNANDLDAADDLVTQTLLTDIFVKHEPIFQQWATIASQYNVNLYAYEAGQGVLWRPAKTDPNYVDTAHMMDDVLKHSQAGAGLGTVHTTLFETMANYYDGANQCGIIGKWGVYDGNYNITRPLQAFGLKQTLDDDTYKWQAFRSLVERWTG